MSVQKLQRPRIAILGSGAMGSLPHVYSILGRSQLTTLIT